MKAAILALVLFAGGFFLGHISRAVIPCIDFTDTRLEKALGALADIGLSDDMNEASRRHKAVRIYREIRGMPPIESKEPHE